MGTNLSKDCKITFVQAPLASGGTDPASNYVDMSGYDGVLFIGCLGTAGSTDVCTLAAQGSTATGSTTFVSITSATQTSTAGLDDKFFAIDVYRPRTRYVKTLLTRSAAVEYGGTVAIQYGGRRVAPVTHGTSTAVSTGTPVAFVVPQTT